MKAPVATCMVVSALCAAAVAQLGRADPHIGYLYPAGGQQGTVFQIIAGGQRLQGVTAVYVSGEGVQASVKQYIPPLPPGQLVAVAKHLRTLAKQRTEEMQAGQEPGRRPTPRQPGEQPDELPPLPDHPLVRDLSQKSLAELIQLRDLLFNPKRQPNAQIAETVQIEVSISADAAPGDRELRLYTPMGISNPLVFQVGSLPEVAEREPNDPRPLLNAPPLSLVDLPVVLNGQIEPGGVDRFRLRIPRPLRLVVRTQARHLVPYLADAVPGWFQATVALYDAQGHELAFADDYRFDPDPVLLYEIRLPGDYELEVRDAIYRGREDFVYRITVGEIPFITRVFPLGGQIGSSVIASLDGWNLPLTQIQFDTGSQSPQVREQVLRHGPFISNPVVYAVDDLPECEEAEPNDDAMQAQPVQLPMVVNGRISEPTDRDVFQFEGRVGEEVVAEVYARRLNSPLDSLLSLTDAAGEVLAWNDDHEDKAAGLTTHHADSYLKSKLPKDGLYLVQVSDSEQHGGDAYAYRLRVAPPRPDFALRVCPSGLNVRPGGAVAFWVHVLRKDGFAGDIELYLAHSPPGFAVQGARLSEGRDSVRMTLTAPRQPWQTPIALHLEGLARIGGQIVTRPAIPAEDMMQAFIYRHLVPAQQLLVAMTNVGRLAPVMQPIAPLPLRLAPGGSAKIRVSTPGRLFAPGLQLELNDPPQGIALEKVTPTLGGFDVVLKADAKGAQIGYRDNLILEAFTETARRRPDGTVGEKRRVSLGILPAIPIEVVAK